MSSYDNQTTKLKITCAARRCILCSGSTATELASLRFYQPIMVKTILALALTLASTEVANNLFIKSARLSRFYEWQYKIGNNQRKATSQSTVIHGTSSNFNDWCGQAALGSGWSQQFGDYIMLFYGSQSHDFGTTINATAVASGGICIYSKVLDMDTFATFDLEGTSLVHICAGIIEHEGKPFFMVHDDTLVASSRTKRACGEAIPHKAFEQGSKLHGQVRETTQGLDICYRIKASNAPSQDDVTIWPAQLANKMAIFRGWVNCNSSGCQKTTETEPLIEADGSGFWEFLGFKFRFAPDDPFAKCTTVAVAFYGDSATTRVLVQDRACIQCCIRAALSGDTQSYYSNMHAENRPDLLWTII